MRANAPLKVRVKTAQLLAAVKACKDADDKAYARAKDAYPAKREAYRAAVIKELRECADKIEKGGKVPCERYGSPGLRFKAEAPKEYARDSSITRTIKTLEMAADESITISADDYARYLG